MAWALEHLLNNLYVLVILAIFDLAIARSRPGRWFLVHSFANLLVVITGLKSMYTVLSDPTNAMNQEVYGDDSLFGDASRWPLTIVNSVHLYHMVAFNDLSSADYFHHLLFIPTIGLTGQICPWGALGNWQAFFISGLPGGLDYFMLFLIKNGKMDKITEKRYNANLNIWLRMPGIFTATILAFCAIRTGRYSAPWPAIAMQLILPPYNALYYAKQSVANYAVHYMLTILGEDKIIKNRIKERTSVTTGEQILQWDFKEPQRGS